MPSENLTSKVSLSTKSTESRCLAIANLPETATEETIKECFQRHGRVQSVRIDDQRFAFVAFYEVRSASKAHNAENLLDEQRLRTAFHDGSNSVPKALLEPPPPLTIPPSSSSSIALPEQPSPLTSSAIADPSSSSSTSSNASNITAVNNSLPSKTTNGDRDKRPSRILDSPDENVRHQVVPVKRDSDSSGSKRKSSSTNPSKQTNNSHSTVQKPPRRKHDNSSSSSSSSSSSESERSSDDSISCKNRRSNPSKTHSNLDESMSKTKILKIFHLPPKMTKDVLRESLWNLFVEYKKSGRLLTVKIDGEHESRFALLTFRKSTDVDKALKFCANKLIGGVRLKAEAYDGIPNENDDCDPVKRTICTDPDSDEYSIKATRTLYIGNLQSEISYNELREAYSAYGDIIELEIKRQTQSQHQFPFAFVQYADIKSVVKAMKAIESKLVRDHSIKLGFGKSQPTNVLWLDELPLNTTETSIRSFITRNTDLGIDQVLDIYIDNRNRHKTQTAQCLIYFSDTRAAQDAINLIRGKRFESKRIQVDFASKVFVTRFSDIIEETNRKKNYVGYPPDSNYHGESRSVSKRNGATREILSDPIQPFDASSTRPNSSERWSNSYNNGNRSQHKSDSRHSSDRRHSKEYGKGTSNLIAIPSVDNGSISGASLGTRRHRLSTSSKDSLSNNLSSSRNPHRSSRTRHHASSTSSSSSRSSSSSSHSSTSTNSLEHRSNSHQRQHSTKHTQKSSKKPSKPSTNNLKPSTGKKSSSHKESTVKSSNGSRSIKSTKDNDSSAIIPNLPQIDSTSHSNLLPEDHQFDSIKKEPSPPKVQQQTSISSTSSTKAPLKNAERVFDWLMQNHHTDSNSSTGLDQNDEEEHLSKPKGDDDCLENVSDEQTSKASPSNPNNNSTITNNNMTSSSISIPPLSKACKMEKSALMAAYRLQPIRTGNKRDEQMDTNSTTNENNLSPSQSTPIIKDDPETNLNHRRVPKAKFHFPPNQTKLIPLDSISSYDQLDVRLKSYPSLFNDHIESIRLPFPQFAFEHIKTSSTSSNVLVVLNPKAHLKHSSLGLNNPSLSSSLSVTSASSLTPTTTPTTSMAMKYESLINTTLPSLNDDESSTTCITVDERIRLLDKQLHERDHGPHKSTASSSSSSSSSSLSPATLIEQQNQKISNTSSVGTTANTVVKSVNEIVTTLSKPTSSATLAHRIQAARVAALNAQPTPSISPSKHISTMPTTSSFHFPPGSSTPSLNLNRTIPTASPSTVNITSVLTPPPPLPPPFSNLSRLTDPPSTSILTTFHAAALAQTQIAAAAAAKYNPLSFATTLHPPPPPVPASLISLSLTLNPPPTLTPTTPPNTSLISHLNCPTPPSLPVLSTSKNLSSPPVSSISTAPSFPDPSTTSPSTSAKILERLGPGAKFKRKPIPPPLAVITTPISNKDSPVLPSPEPLTPTTATGSNAHRSPVTHSPPVLQSQLSNSSSNLKSILKQRSLSNPSSTSSLSPTNDRKSTTSYVSPLASSETRPTLQMTSTNTRSPSIDSAPKSTPPSTPTLEKKKHPTQSDSSVFTNDVDERHADEKKSAWRTPPTKQAQTNETSNIKKPILDKIPKKSSAIPTTPTTPKPTNAESTKVPVKVTKPNKQTPATPISSKMPQLTLERVDMKSLKTAPGSTEKSTPKSTKLKRTMVMQSDSDTEKKSTKTDAQKLKKPSVSNEVNKNKQPPPPPAQPQKALPVKKTQVSKPMTKTPSVPARKISTTDTHSSESDGDESKLEDSDDDDETSSDDEDKTKKEISSKHSKSQTRTKSKSTSNRSNPRDLKQTGTMYDRIKKRPRNEQIRTSEDQVSSESNDDESETDGDDQVSTRVSHAPVKRHNAISDSSESEVEMISRGKPKKATIYDNDIFDAEESDEKSKALNRKKKTNQVPTLPAKKPAVKPTNELPKKEKVSKINDEQTPNKKKMNVPKIVEKKKLPALPTKSIPKVVRPTAAAQKRPSTDEPNESIKKRKLEENKSKTPAIEEQNSTVSNQMESDTSVPPQPTIVISSASNETPSNPPKATESPAETNTQSTPTKFGIVFPSHRHSTTTPPSSMRTQSTETSTSHETSKHEDEDMDDDNESGATHDNNKTIHENDQLPTNTNTLKPPNKVPPPLSDDETLNPETMQLSDLIGTTRREETKPAHSRSGGKRPGKGKRTAKQETATSKRQPTKTNAKTTPLAVSNEKEAVTRTNPVPLSTIEQVPSTTTAKTKRLSSTETASTSSPNSGDKEAKRLRKSIDDSTAHPQIKLEPMENLPPSVNIQSNGESTDPKISSITIKQEVLPPSSSIADQPAQVTSMETEQIPLPSSIITSTQSPSRTSVETENVIKAVYSNIQIPQPSVSKSSAIIAPISKETLPIVEHQPVPIQTTSILPAHGSTKSSVPQATFNENVDETLNAVNSLLMLNNNPSNIPGDHSSAKGTARVPPTISKPVYTFVPSLPSPTDQQSRQTTTTTVTPTTTTTSVSTPSTQSKDLITMVSNIVSSSNLTGEKSTVTNAPTTTTARSHIEEVIDDVAKGTSTTTIVTEPTASIVDTIPLSSVPPSSTPVATTKTTPIPNILGNVMKTPCLTSSTTVTTTTVTTAASETLNLFDTRRRSTPSKMTTSTVPTTTTTTTASSTPVVPVVVRPISAKTSTSQKHSSASKADPPSSTASLIHPFSHLLGSDNTLFAAVHHQNFPFSLFGPLSSNPPNPTGNSSSNLLAPSLVSSSPPLATRTSSSSTSSSTAITNSHIMTNPFLNPIATGQTNANLHTHEKASRRESSTKGSGTSSSSSSRSTPIQQTVPVPIALSIPSSSSSSASGTTTTTAVSQQQASPLINPLDAAAVALRQQASPLPSFLGTDPNLPFRNVYTDQSDLFVAPSGLYPPQNMTYAAQQMLNAMSMTGSHHPSAAFAAELYSHPDPFLRLNIPTNELSYDPYNVRWQGNLILKNDQAYVKTQLVAGSPQIARASMNYWNSDSLSSTSSNLQSSSHHNLRISQRMRLEQAQLEGVQKRMQMDNDHCILIAEPNGSTPDEIRIQQNNLKNGVIRYFDEKKAAGIVNVLLPGASQPAYVVHIFPPCQFASEILQKRAPDTYRCVVQNKIEQIYLLIVITSTVQ